MLSLLPRLHPRRTSCTQIQTLWIDRCDGRRPAAGRLWVHIAQRFHECHVPESEGSDQRHPNNGSYEGDPCHPCVYACLTSVIGCHCSASKMEMSDHIHHTWNVVYDRNFSIWNDCDIHDGSNHDYCVTVICVEESLILIALAKWIAWPCEVMAKENDFDCPLCRSFRRLISKIL